MLAAVPGAERILPPYALGFPHQKAYSTRFTLPLTISTYLLLLGNIFKVSRGKGISDEQVTQTVQEKNVCMRERQREGRKDKARALIFTVNLYGTGCGVWEFFACFCNISVNLQLFQHLIKTTCTNLKNAMRSHSIHGMLRTSRSIQTESGAGGQEEWGVAANGQGALFWGDENFLELDRGNGCTTF